MSLTIENLLMQRTLEVDQSSHSRDCGGVVEVGVQSTATWGQTCSIYVLTLGGESP